MFTLFIAGAYYTKICDKIISKIFVFVPIFVVLECSNVVVQGITILSPVTSPNTDGINPGEYAQVINFLAIF